MRRVPSRLRRAAACVTLAASCLATNPAAAQASLQDLSAALPALPPIGIYQAREVITLDPATPTARGVAVVGNRIRAVGELEDLTRAAGTRPYEVNTQFADQVVVPGFIAQHDRPLLAAASARMKDPNALLLTWGYHQYFHGKLAKADLDAISTTRPIIVRHRSAHEIELNTAAERTFGVTKAWFDKLPDSARKQSDFFKGHYWVQG